MRRCSTRHLAELQFKCYGTRPFPPFSDEALYAFQATFGVELPTDYVHFVRSHNGGAAALDMYNDPIVGGMGQVNDFYGLGYARRR